MLSARGAEAGLEVRALAVSGNGPTLLAADSAGVAIGDVVDRCAAPFVAGTDLDALRDDVQRLMGRIVRHRQHGSDLVWEAYAIDIGGAG